MKLGKSLMQKPAVNKKRLSRRSRLLLALALGSGAGALCPLLPEDYQGVCGLLAKALGILFGG